MQDNSNDLFERRFKTLLDKLENNNMDVIHIDVKGTQRSLTNTYITYKCRKCGAISTPASIIQLSRRASKCPNRCQILIWDYNKCYDAARKCTYIEEFRTKFAGAYKAACENKWLKDYNWLKKTLRKPLMWNYKNTYEEAKKYDSRYSFSKGAPGAYLAAWSNDWLNDYTWFKKSYQDVQRADILCKINARLENFPDLYFDESEFANYTVGRKMKITLHCRKHPQEKIVRSLRNFIYGRDPQISYCKRCVDDKKFKYADFDEMVEELKKYRTLSEARSKDLCLIEHLRKTKEGKKFVDMLERANSAWKRGIYSYEFRISKSKFVYVGLTCNFERRDREHRHLKDSAIYNFAIEHNLEIPKMKKETDYLDWDLASEQEQKFMDMYQEQGYKLINKIPGGGLGAVCLKRTYTLEEAKNDILQNRYKNINDISHRNATLYRQILNHIIEGDEGWAELMPQKTRRHPNYWTKDRVKEIFEKFDSIPAMTKAGYSSAYSVFSIRYRYDDELSRIVEEKFKISLKNDERKIGKFDDEGNLLAEFNNKYEVCPIHIGFSTLSKAISKNLKARGYYWRYI